MRTASLLTAGAVLVLTSFPAGPVGAEEEAGAGLSSYRLLANAPGLAMEGFYKDVALTVPEATSSLSTGGVGTGLAAVAWPGPILGNAGTTLLVLNGSVPPEVTLLNDPVRAESHSGGEESAVNGDVPGTTMTSTATRTKVTAASRTGTGAVLPVGGLEVLTGTTSAQLTGATTATSTASSAVQGFSLLDGAVRIGAVTSTATATTDGVKAVVKGSTEVTGMTVGGIPVTVDETGLHVAGSDAPNPVTQQVLDSVTSSLGLTALLTTPRSVVEGSTGRYDAAALVLLYAQGADTYSVTLGRASASVAASRSDGLSLPETPAVPGVLPPAPVTAPQVGGVAPPSAPVVPGSVPPAVAPPGEAPATSTPLLPAALSVVLAGGPSSALVLAVLAVVGLLGAALPRLPRLLLAVPGSPVCEEQKA